LYHKTNLLCIAFSFAKVGLEKYPWFFLGGFIPCLMFSPFRWECDKWPQNIHEVENMAKTPTQIGQYFNDNFNMYCVIHIN
jgi:hypothetical protein